MSLCHNVPVCKANRKMTKQAERERILQNKQVCKERMRRKEQRKRNGDTDKSIQCNKRAHQRR